MASILPAFEYDIFISYRQKDNKGDRWVTEFVNALKSELDSTFKEDISIYFDENPHDGLLETHDVDDSLREKLKCLIFIPIISQTYCDPKSFAWKHEFLAFKKLANEDQLGLKIRLQHGNVASRILPVRIHELDENDKAVVESEIGPIRAIDFIFKSAGVNRPLRVKDDEIKERSHATFHRDQINKVANAIKEIISSLSNPSTQNRRVSDKDPALIASGVNKKRAIAMAALLSLIFISYLIYRNFFIVNQAPAEKSIAVLPFENLSGENEQEYFSDGMTEELINTLTQITGLKVAGRSSSFYFKGKNPEIKEVAQKLDVSSVLSGSVQRQGRQVRITVQLVNASDGFQLWSQKFDRSADDVFSIYDDIAKSVADKLMATVLGRVNKYKPSQAAYDQYLKGLFFWNKRGRHLFTALEYFKKSAELDSLYPLAHAGIAESLVLIGRYSLRPPIEVMPLCKLEAEKAIRLDPVCVEAYTALAYQNMLYEWNWDETERLFKKAIEIDPQYTPAHYLYETFLATIKGDFASARSEGQKALELEPLSHICNFLYSSTLNWEGKTLEALDYAQRATELDPNSLSAIHMTSGYLMKLGRCDEAVRVVGAAITRNGELSDLESYLCQAHVCSGNIVKAKEIYSELKERLKTEYISPYILLLCANSLRNTEEARFFLQKAMEERSTSLDVYAKEDPTFRKLIERINAHLPMQPTRDSAR